jgi:serine/threonine protein kinase
MPLDTGEVIQDRYRVVEQIAQGGFGAIYRAWDLNLRRPCALKFNLESSPEAQKQFAREATMLANLRHLNLARVTDYFILPGQGQYLVMDYVEGEDLQEKINQAGGALPEAQVVPWIEQVNDAISYLHSQAPPIIHRDIKPANIKITPQGVVKLVDFGIAKIYYAGQKTTIGAQAVTPGYSPPEQYGKGQTDARTDIYALGATLYAAVTGHTPVESLQRQTGQPLPSPHYFNPVISPHIEAAILQAMQISPDLRYQTAVEFKTALHESQAGIQVAPILPTQVSPSPPAAQPGVVGAPAIQPQSKKRPSWLLPIAAALVLICAFSIAMGYGLLTYLPTSSQATETQLAIFLFRTQTELALIPSDTPETTFDTPHWTSTPTTKVDTITTTATPTFTSTALPTKTPTPTPTPSPVPTVPPVATWYPCAGLYPSRLHVGDRAYVSFSPPLANNVRKNPSLNAQLLGKIQPGEEVEILKGPDCNDNMVWWRVQAADSSLVGWTSEGDREHYWLVPIP